MIYLFIWSLWIIEYNMIKGSLEVKLPTIWTHEKQRRKSEEKVREEKIKEGKVRESQKKEDTQVLEKVAKSQNTVFFRIVSDSGRSKSRLAKARRCGAKHMSKSKV